MTGEYDASFQRAPAGYDPVYGGGRGGYGREYEGYGADSELPGDAPSGWPRFRGRPPRRWVARSDWREWGGPAAFAPGWTAEIGMRAGPHGRPDRPRRVFRGYERREPYPRGERHYRNVPPDWRRYLSEDGYGLGPGRRYDRDFEDDRFRRGPLGPRNALFGREGFARYDRDFDEQWW